MSWDEFKELVLRCRSYRRFDERVKISPQTLLELVDLARLSASAANMQPLRYVLSCTPERNALIYPCLGWAGYLTEWPGPAEGERPTAYIVILEDRNIPHPCRVDHGIAAQTILLGATLRGLGGCMIGSINRDRLRQVLKIAEKYEILLVIALGKPAEEVRIVSLPDDGSVKYWRDERGVHYVPKRPLAEVVIG